MRRLLDSIGAGLAVIRYVLRQAWPARIPRYVYEAANKVGIAAHEVLKIDAHQGVITIIVAYTIDAARREGLSLHMAFAVPANTLVRIEQAPWRQA